VWKFRGPVGPCNTVYPRVGPGPDPVHDLLWIMKGMELEKERNYLELVKERDYCDHALCKQVALMNY
jgi:hypothetical protein